MGADSTHQLLPAASPVGRSGALISVLSAAPRLTRARATMAGCARIGGATSTTLSGALGSVCLPFCCLRPVRRLVRRPPNQRRCMLPLPPQSPLCPQRLCSQRVRVTQEVRHPWEVRHRWAARHRWVRIQRTSSRRHCHPDSGPTADCAALFCAGGPPQMGGPPGGGPPQMGGAPPMGTHTARDSPDLHTPVAQPDRETRISVSLV